MTFYNTYSGYGDYGYSSPYCGGYSDPCDTYTTCNSYSTGPSFWGARRCRPSYNSGAYTSFFSPYSSPYSYSSYGGYGYGYGRPYGGAFFNVIDVAAAGVMSVATLFTVGAILASAAYRG